MPRSRNTAGSPQLRLVVEAPSSPPELSDSEILDAIERGDRDIAELLYDRLCDTVSATLVKIFGRRDVEHDDLVQTAFEQLFLTLARKSFAHTCSLKSWAVSITSHVALNALRKRRSHRRHIEQEQCSQEYEIRTRGIDPERSAQLSALREELARLSPLTAQVIILHEIMGHGLAEVAALTGLSVTAAQSRLVRGRDELRKRLDSMHPEAAR